MAGLCGEYCALLWFYLSVRFPWLRRAAMWAVWAVACRCSAVRTRAFVRGGRRVRLLAAGSSCRSWSRVHATAYWFFALAADRSPAALRAAGLGSCWIRAEGEDGNIFIRFEKDGQEYWWSRVGAGSAGQQKQAPLADGASATAGAAGDAGAVATGSGVGSAGAPVPIAGAGAAQLDDCPRNLPIPDPIDLGRMIARAFESPGGLPQHGGRRLVLDADEPGDSPGAPPTPSAGTADPGGAEEQ